MPDSDEALSRQNEALTRAMLEWIASAPRTRDELMRAWQSTCPRHTIWEDAVIAGLIEDDGGRGGAVELSARGRALLDRRAT